MQITALLSLIVVAIVGIAMLLRRRKGLHIPAFIVRSHGLFAALATLLLLVAAYSSWLDDLDNTWTWISAALVSSVLAGAYLLFRKLLAGRRKPMLILYLHGIFACISIGTFMYSLAI